MYCGTEYRNQYGEYPSPGISNYILKQCSENIAPFLTRFFTECLRKGKMPGCWKKALVTPIHKGGKFEDIANYRPISLLCCVPKILERVVCESLSDFLLENTIIGHQQFGFVKNSSTVDQLLDLYHTIVSSLDRHRMIKIVFLDVSKVFDQVWRKGLIHKLRWYGIRGQLLAWFDDYLKDRLQSVALKGYLSTWLEIIGSVPQGSILGPILYLNFAEDMKEQIAASLRIFADDTILYAMGLTERDCARVIQPSLNAVCE